MMKNTKNAQRFRKPNERRWLVVLGGILLAIVLLGGLIAIRPPQPNLARRPSQTAPVPSPTLTAPSRAFSETGHSLRGPYLTFWEQHNGQQTLGPPISDPLWLDGQEVQFFANARLAADAPGSSATTIISTTLAAGWKATMPPILFARPAASQRVTLTAPPTAEPQLSIPVALSIPGYTGSVELQIYDRDAQPAGSWLGQARKGTVTIQIDGRGLLGVHQAVVLLNGQIAGAQSNLFTLDAQTTIQTGQRRFDELYSMAHTFMLSDTETYQIDGFTVHGYRSPDNNLLWLRDHTYQAHAARYFDPDMTSLIDAFRRAQRPDGSFPDNLTDPHGVVPTVRLDVEADVEYLFVQAVYDAWQATGDDIWLRQNLDAMQRAIHYTMSDPMRWDSEHQLVKRPFTIDTWDFQYGPTTIDPTNGRPAPRHWIDDKTIWGIFHGDNTGLAGSLLLLAQMEQHLGDETGAAQWRAESAGIMQRLNALSWNGSFFTHQIHLTPFSISGFDESKQLSLSNALALNRNVLTFGQTRAIVDKYYHRFLSRGKAFAEWFSIDPPFPPGSFGMDNHAGEQPGEYVNGGIMPLVGGELARGAFHIGAERYAFDILARYHFLISSTGATYLWYYPAGNPGKSSPDTLPTDGWGASAMLSALTEGAAGVEDQSTRYHDITLSPRWTYAGDVNSARVVTRYAASDGYVAYRWQSSKHSLSLNFTSSAEHTTIRLLLPEKQKTVTLVTLDGQPHAYTIEEVVGSHYVTFTVDGGSGVVQVGW